MNLPYLKPSVSPPATYLLTNVRSALLSPGEWALTRDGKLYYKPEPGRTPKKSTIIAPVSDKLLTLIGDPEHRKYVKYISFKELSFEYSQENYPYY